MARDHARIHLDIWGDDDWLDLPADAQCLYLTLYLSPGRTLCGAHEWNPAKLTQRAADWTMERIEAAAEVLSRELFLIIDTDTGECLLRSWIKHDGLWRTPNMAVSVANARANLASRTLRGVIVHEVLKLKKTEPKSGAWERDAVQSMLGQKSINPAELEPFKGGSNPTANPPPNPSAKGAPNPTVNENPTLGVNPTSNGAPTISNAIPTAINNRGYVSREPHQGATLDPNDPHPPRCLEHMDDPSPPACGRCADVRKADEALQRSLRELAEEQRRQFLAEIDACSQCDEHGWALGDNDEPIEPATRCAQHDWSPAHA